MRREDDSTIHDPLKESFDRFVAKVKDGNTFSGSLRKKKRVRSRTTILAMKFFLQVRDGEGEDVRTFKVPAVVIASDGRSTAYRVESDSTKKIRCVDERTAIAGSGIGYLCDQLSKYFQLSVRDFDDNIDPIDHRLTLRSKTEMLSNIVVRFTNWDDSIGFILVGYEENENRCRIFEVWQNGDVIDKGDFGGSGSGYDPVMGLLETYAGKTYTARKVVNVMRKVIKIALKHDPYSGGKCRAVIITPLGSEEVSLNE